MRNAVDFSQLPEDLFLNPAEDPGISFLTKPEFFWRRRNHAVIEAFPVSAHESISVRITAHIQHVKRHRMFHECVEFNTVPVVLEDASFRKSYATAKGKCVLSGASGMRLQNNYEWENEKTPGRGEAALVEYFNLCQSKNTKTGLKVWQSDLPADLPFAIECRNTFNYYHFITESLCQLCLLDDLAFDGPIFFHFPNHPEKTRGFTWDFVKGLFPELADRVVFERVPKDYVRVLTPYNFLNSYYHYPSTVMGSVDELAPSAQYWKGRTATRASQGILSANSVDKNLLRLRDRALLAVKDYPSQHLPKRFWVGRAHGHSRDRVMEGEDALFALLAQFGFEYVVFETLSPLDQIAIMAGAEVMISSHGAGFTNMLFANSQATVIELGTLQTAMYRWGDFWQLANVSQCRYVSFFADYKKDNPLIDPHFATDGIVPVSLSPDQVWHVMEFVAAILNAPPVMNTEADLHRLVSQMITVGADAQSLAVLERNESLVTPSATLCLLRADCHRKLDQTHAELLALIAAEKADPTRWTTLAQIIWCAKKLDNAEVIRWAARRLALDFPTRLAALVKDRPWLARLV